MSNISLDLALEKLCIYLFLSTHELWGERSLCIWTPCVWKCKGVLVHSSSGKTCKRSSFWFKSTWILVALNECRLRSFSYQRSNRAISSFVWGYLLAKLFQFPIWNESVLSTSHNYPKEKIYFIDYLIWHSVIFCLRQSHIESYYGWQESCRFHFLLWNIKYLWPFSVLMRRYLRILLHWSSHLTYFCLDSVGCRLDTIVFAYKWKMHWSFKLSIVKRSLACSPSPPHPPPNVDNLPNVVIS